jgi:quinol-cytochrome oxidoreductase complex cytochrome b subunit
MTPITNIAQLNQLMNSTMIYAVVVGLVAVLLALLLANMFPWEGRNDRSYIKRRIAFVVIGIIAVLGFWMYNDLAVMVHIKNVGFQNMFKSCNLKCMGINVGVYLLASILLMFTFRHSKFGSILGKEKK